MVIAITGLTGFLGYFFAKRFSNMENIKMKALVRKTSNLMFLEEFRKKISFVNGDLEDRESLAELVEGAHVVVHAAYYRENDGFINGGLSNRKKFLDLNLLGSHDLLEESKKADVKQFIFMSSCAVFGAVDPVLPLDEKHPLQPDSLYGAYKASVESLCHAYFLGEGLETVIFRPVAIYGKHPQFEKCRWRTIVEDIKNGKDVNVFGGGKIVCADDVVQAVTCVLGNKGVAGNIYALSDLFISEIEIAEIIKNLSGSKSEITGVRKVQKNVMVNDKAKRLGVHFRGKDGLRDYIKSILEQ